MNSPFRPCHSVMLGVSGDEVALRSSSPRSGAILTTVGPKAKTYKKDKQADHQQPPSSNKSSRRAKIRR